MKRFLFLIALLLAVPAAAQVTTASLGGRIVDENGPIEGVTVVAIHQQTNTQYYVTTDRHGWYQLSDILPGGPYTVRIHYFEYKPLTVRNLFAAPGRNTVVDADLETGETFVRSDEAATAMYIGEAIEGGEVSLSPLTYNLVGQRTYTEVPFDVRQEAPLAGASRLQLTPLGSNRFHASAYGYYGSYGAGGLTMATPLAGEDCQLFAGLQYDGQAGLTGTGRFDARFNESNRLDISGGRLSAGDAWASAGFTTSMLDGRASNRAQGGWYDTGSGRQLLVSDDFTYGAGAQRLLFGVQVAQVSIPVLDSAATRFDFYLQDVMRLGRRLTVQAGIRFSFPFAFSPRVSVNYDVLGNDLVVLRAGAAVYGRHGEGSVWKNLAAVDLGLPARFKLSLEAVYGQSWRRAFYISSKNILDSRYALTARLERPLAENMWAVASYTKSDGPARDRLIGGFSYKAAYLGHLATTLAVLYDGYSLVDELSPASVSWKNCIETRVTQDLGLELGGRGHMLQFTGYVRHSSLGTEWLASLRYLL